MSVQNQIINNNVAKNKMECKVCGSKIIDNTKNITAHNKTIKHQNALNGVTPTKGAKEISDDPKKIAERTRIAEYRAKRKTELGEKKYKDQQTKYKQAFRAKQSTVTEVQITESEAKSQLNSLKSPTDLPEIKKKEKVKLVLEAVVVKAGENQEAVIEKIVKAGKGSVKSKTVKTNLDRVAGVYKYSFNKQWDYISYDWLKDTDDVYEKVNEKYKGMSEKTRSNQFVSIAGVLKFFPTYKKEYGIYSKLGSGIVDKLDKVSKDNTLKTNQSDWLNWGQIEKVWPKLVNSNGGNTFIRALYGMYCFIPPRRVMDYQLLKIVRKDKMSDANIKKLDKKFNYLFVDKNSKPLSMTIWNYKEGARRSWAKKNGNYGQYVLDPIPERLVTVLHEYIKDEDLKGNDFLFGLDSNHQKHYAENAFSSLVSNNLFETFSDVHITVNSLRHSYASWYWDKLKTYNLKELFTERMGSSIQEIERTYYKIPLTPDYVKPKDE
tara:strand:- start:29 stop:1501 length:1473 start_codon:yes stop_codon:yes gene_type:complete